MKNSSVKVVKTISAPANEVWHDIAKIGGIEEWSSPIADSAVTGEGVGARRVCNMVDGSGKIYETIETIDHEKRIFQYSIQQLPMPIKNVIGTMKVETLENDDTQVTWSVDFQVDEENEAMMQETITGFYEDVILGLERINQANI